MRFGDMRDRVILLKPGYSYTNSMNETVPVWVPFHPFNPNLAANPPVLTVTEGVPEAQYAWGKTRKDAEPFAVWAKAQPTTGREYEEAQKIRAETTWKVKMRYAESVTTECKILVRDKVLNIESVLDVNGAKKELTLICVEVDAYGRERN